MASEWTVNLSFSRSELAFLLSHAGYLQDGIARKRDLVEKLVQLIRSG